MSDPTDDSAQAEQGWQDEVIATAESWYVSAEAVATGNSGVVEAVGSGSHDSRAVQHVRNLGNMAVFGITTGYVVLGGFPMMGALASGATCAFIGAGIVDYFALDEKLLDYLGKPRLAKPGRQPAAVGDEIAHSSALASALGGLLAAVAVGALFAAVAISVVGTGGLAAPLIVGAAAGLGGGFTKALVSGFFSKAATVTGKIVEGSPNVFFEGRPVARVEDQVSCSRHSPVKKIAQGSETVYINNRPLARIGHKTTCGATIQEGCKTIFADDTTETYFRIDSELSAAEQAVVSAAEVVLTLGVGRLASKLGARCGDPVNPADGSFCDSRTDVEYPSVLPLKLTRTYAGRDPVESALGSKWICNWSQRLVYLSDEPAANLEDGDGEVLQFPLGKPPEFNSRNLKAPHYHLKGTRQRALLFDSRCQQTLVFETTGTHPDIGRLAAIEDRNNNRIDFIYEGNHLRRVEHSDGAMFLVTTTPRGFIETVTLELDGICEEIVRYGYTAGGELSSVHGRFAGEFHYTYTGEGWLNHWHDSGATSADIEYDGEGRVIATRMPDGTYNDRFSYFPEERKTEYHPATGGCATFRFNDNNQLIREQDPLGNVTTHEVSGLDRVLSTTDALGRTTTFEYDIFGHLIGQTDWTGRTTILAYNREGQLTRIDYPDGASSSWKYDEHGNLVAATGSDGVTTLFSYDEKGRLLYEIGPDGYSRIEYTTRGRLAAVLDPLGNRTAFEVDRWGRPRSITDPSGHATRYEYDLSPDNPRGDVSRVIHPDGGEERFAYDQEGMPALHVAPEGQTTCYSHGSNDLLRRITDPGGCATTLEYDAAARLKGITNAQGQKWSLSYDLAGNLAVETDWAGRQTRYVRDAIGRVVSKRLPDGVEQRLTWDELDRIVAVDTEKQRISYEYDNADRLVRASAFDKENEERESDLQFVYDDKGWLAKEIQNGFDIEYAYDASGRCISRTSPTGATRYGFDKAGQLKGLESNGHSLDFTRDERGLETERRYRGEEKAPLDAFTLKQSYDPCGRLKRQLAGRERQLSTHERLAEVSRRYRLDKSGRLIGLNDNKRGSSSYHYDPRDQVTGIIRQAGLNKHVEERFSYDELLNLAESSGQSHRYRDGTVRAIGPTSYRYDVRGRVTEKRVERNGFRPKAWRYLWDDFDRLVETRTPDGAVWRYTYDAFGRRIRKECLKAGESGKQLSTYYFWQGATLIEEWETDPREDDSPLATTRWHFEPGTFNPLARETRTVSGKEDPGAHFHPIVTDHLGTPKEMFDAGGECLWQADQELWGRTTVKPLKTRPDSHLPLVGCRLRFQNQWEDAETGLFYNLNRYYDPDSGQYLSPDPIGLEGGLRTHGYVHDPMQWVDPLGLCKEPKIPLKNNSVRKLLKSRGLSKQQARDIVNSFDGQIYARQGRTGEMFTITESALGRGSGIFVTRGSAGSTPAKRIRRLALPPSNTAQIEETVLLTRDQLLLEGRVAPQPTWGTDRTGGGWQVVTKGGRYTGAVAP